MNKKIIQICFSLNTGLSMSDIEYKLIELKDKLNNKYGVDNYEVRSCHLSRKICLNKGYTTDIPDLFDEIFGSNYVCELTEDTFDEAMTHIMDHRKELSKKADNLVLLSSDQITNVALELQLFTQNRVLIL